MGGKIRYARPVFFFTTAFFLVLPALLLFVPTVFFFFAVFDLLAVTFFAGFFFAVAEEEPLDLDLVEDLGFALVEGFLAVIVFVVGYADKAVTLNDLLPLYPPTFSTDKRGLLVHPAPGFARPVPSNPRVTLIKRVDNLALRRDNILFFVDR